MTDNTADTSAWRRLGTMLIQRRVAIDPRYRNRRVFAEEAGLDYRLIYDAEEARRVNFGASTLAAIEGAYRLRRGAIADILAGGELEPQRPALTVVPEDGSQLIGQLGDLFPHLSAEAKAEAAPHFREIEGRAFGAAMTEAEQRGISLAAALDEVPDGHAVFPDQPREAAWWDGLRSQGLPSGPYSVSRLAQVVAVLRVREAHSGNGEGNAGTGLAAR